MANPSPDNSVGILLASATGFPAQVGDVNPLPVRPADPASATYSAAITGLVPAAAATDVFTLIGSATKVVRLISFGVSGTATTAALVDTQIIRRSAANTGGTSTTPAAVPNDTADAAATAVVRAYTANPSALGASVGVMRSEKLLIADATNPRAVTNALVETHANAHKPIILRGAAETLALNLNGATVTGGSLDVYVEWTETDV